MRVDRLRGSGVSGRGKSARRRRVVIFIVFIVRLRLRRNIGRNDALPLFVLGGKLRHRRNKPIRQENPERDGGDQPDHAETENQKILFTLRRAVRAIAADRLLRPVLPVRSVVLAIFIVTKRVLRGRKHARGIFPRDGRLRKNVGGRLRFFFCFFF